MLRDLLAEEEGEEVDYGTDELEADELTPEEDSQIKSVRGGQGEPTHGSDRRARISWGDWKGADQPGHAPGDAGDQPARSRERDRRHQQLDIDDTRLGARRRADQHDSRMREPSRQHLHVRPARSRSRSHSPPASFRQVELRRPPLHIRDDWPMHRLHPHEREWYGNPLPRRPSPGYPLSASPPRHLPVRRAPSPDAPGMPWDARPRALPPPHARYDITPPRLRRRLDSPLHEPPPGLRRIPAGPLRLGPLHYPPPHRTSHSPPPRDSHYPPERMLQRAPLTLDRQLAPERWVEPHARPRPRPRQTGNFTPPPMINGPARGKAPAATSTELTKAREDKLRQSQYSSEPARAAPGARIVTVRTAAELANGHHRTSTRESSPTAPARSDKRVNEAKAAAKRSVPEQTLFSDRHRLQSSKVLSSSTVSQAKGKDAAALPERPAKRAVSPNSMQQFQSWQQSTFQDDKAAEARKPDEKDKSDRQAAAAKSALPEKASRPTAAADARSTDCPSKAQQEAKPTRKRAHSPEKAEIKPDHQPASKKRAGSGREQQASDAKPVRLQPKQSSAEHAAAATKPRSSEKAAASQYKIKHAQPEPKARQAAADVSVKVAVSPSNQQQPRQPDRRQEASGPANQPQHAAAKAPKNANTAVTARSTEQRSSEQRKSTEAKRTDPVDQPPGKAATASKPDRPISKLHQIKPARKDLPAAAAAAANAAVGRASGPKQQQYKQADKAKETVSKRQSSQSANASSRQDGKGKLISSSSKLQPRRDAKASSTADKPEEAQPAKGEPEPAVKPKPADKGQASSKPATKAPSDSRRIPGSPASKQTAPGADSKSKPDSSAQRQGPRADSKFSNAPAPDTHRASAVPQHADQNPQPPERRAATSEHLQKRSREQVASQAPDRKSAEAKYDETLPPPPPLPLPPPKLATKPAAKPEAPSAKHSARRSPSPPWPSNVRQGSPAHRHDERRPMLQSSRPRMRSRSRSPRRHSPGYLHARDQLPESVRRRDWSPPPSMHHVMPPHLRGGMMHRLPSGRMREVLLHVPPRRR